MDSATGLFEQLMAVFHPLVVEGRRHVLHFDMSCGRVAGGKAGLDATNLVDAAQQLWLVRRPRMQPLPVGRVRWTAETAHRTRRARSLALTGYALGRAIRSQVCTCRMSAHQGRALATGPSSDLRGCRESRVKVGIHLGAKGLCVCPPEWALYCA
jgi:hypothetical protein